jgi:chemotaxis methyl-accepting protein methylase
MLNITPPRNGSVPPNVRFELDDIEDDWVYQRKFDFIFARYLMGAIKDWPRLMQQAYE